MSRLELDHDQARVVVGYDPDLATYYVETGPRPATDAVDEVGEDADEQLVTVRGRVHRDLPDLSALVADLYRRGVTLTPHQHAALSAPPRASRRRAR